MSLRRKPNGIYFADVYGRSGRRVRKSSGTRDEAAAKEWYAKLLNDLWRQKSLDEKPRRKWDEAVANYMMQKAGTASEDQNITRIATLHPFLGGQYLADIDRERLTLIKHSLGETMKASTVNRYLSFISAVLHHACNELGWLDAVPKIKKAEETPTKVEFLTPEEVDNLVAELGSKPRTAHLVPFVIFAIATGLRMRNVTHLRWSQIDMPRRTMWVDAPDAKARRSISVPLTDDACAVIRAQMGKHSEYVFTFRGKPYDRVNGRTLRSAAKRCGIEKHLHPHLFRHTFASWHIMSGTSVLELMRLGGWAKVDSVLIYAHLSSEHLRSAAENRAQIRHTFETALHEAGINARK